MYARNPKMELTTLMTSLLTSICLYDVPGVDGGNAGAGGIPFV
jgi:hypothetical protein